MYSSLRNPLADILCVGDDSYILADFENARRDGDRMPDDLLNSRVLDPLKSSDYGHVYRSCHDMYQFGQLIAYPSDLLLQQLQMRMHSDNVKRRHTAVGALCFLSNLQKRVRDDRLNAMEQ